MSSSPLRYYLLTVALSAFIVTGCSSSGETNLELEDESLGEELLMSDDELPDADAVGSIPEDDAFNNLDKGDEIIEDGDGGIVEGSEGVEDENNPFADLADDFAEENAPDSVAVSEGEMANYRVRHGDTLMKIAFSLYGDLTKWRDLRTWNADTVGDGNNISPGMLLKYVYQGNFVRQQLDYSYLIRRGDTLGGIAKQLYGEVMKYKTLQRYNPRLIRDPNRIYAGFTLYYNLTPQEKRDAGPATRTLSGTSPAIIPSAQPLSKGDKPMAVAPSSVPAAAPLAPSGK